MIKNRIFDEILCFFPSDISRAFDEVLDKEWMRATEIRIRNSMPIIIHFFDDEKVLKHFITAEDILKLVGNFSDNSLYMVQNDINKGFLTIKGGHRIGISGTCIFDERDLVKNIKFISSLNIRIAREVKMCSNFILDCILNRNRKCIGNLIIVSPPGCGKTTILRDLIRNLSNGYKELEPQTVGVVDERSEIAAMYNGQAQNDVGIRTDVMNACNKSVGLKMMIRSMGPKYIATDEIGLKEDINAILDAVSCGIKLLVTCHGSDISDVPNELLNGKVFDSIVILRKDKIPGCVEKIYFRNGDGYNVVF